MIPRLRQSSEIRSCGVFKITGSVVVPDLAIILILHIYNCFVDRFGDPSIV